MRAVQLTKVYSEKYHHDLGKGNAVLNRTKYILTVKETIDKFGY